MSQHDSRGKPLHHHGPGCGHTAIRHEGHIDYLRDGRLEHQEGDQVDAHRIAVSEQNPDGCIPDPRCAHHPGWTHRAEEERHHHPIVPHGDHLDSLHEGHLHHHHGDHCDDHGPVDVLET